jgi:hypothetical protein
VYVGRDSSVGMATRCRLDGRGSNPDGARFFAPIQNGPGANPASYLNTKERYTLTLTSSESPKRVLGSGALLIVKFTVKMATA